MDQDTKTTTVAVEEEKTEVVENQTLQGNCVFIIETVAAGVAVQTALLTEDKNIHLMPAVFPTLQYALQQIDELRTHMINHFESAAQVGLKMIAENAAQANANITSDTGIITSDTTKAEVKSVANKAFKKTVSY
jgi:hypothetical protein